MLVEDYLKLENDEQFDIVVNDMKMDVGKSVNIINQFYDRIKEDGIVIITFKLPHEYNYSSIKKWIGSFNGFQLIGARQLFHNTLVQPPGAAPKSAPFSIFFISISKHSRASRSLYSALETK